MPNPHSTFRRTLTAALPLMLIACQKHQPQPYKHLYPISVHAKYGYIDRTGQLAVQPQFDDAGEFAEGLAPVMTGRAWGYIDQTGAFTAHPQFDEARQYSEGLAAVRVGDRFGYIGREGAYVIPPQFEAATQYHEGLAAVRIGEKWGIINAHGKQVVGELKITPATQPPPQPPAPQPTSTPPTQTAADHVAQAKALSEQGKYDDAITECDAALKIDPAHKDAQDLKAQIEQTKKILGYK